MDLKLCWSPETEAWWFIDLAEVPPKEGLEEFLFGEYIYIYCIDVRIYSNIYVQTWSNMYNYIYTLKNDVQTCVSMYTHSWIFLYISSTCNQFPAIYSHQTWVKQMLKYYTNINLTSKNNKPRESQNVEFSDPPGPPLLGLPKFSLRGGHGRFASSM